jgi:hypothetical protein
VFGDTQAAAIENWNRRPPVCVHDWVAVAAIGGYTMKCKTCGMIQVDGLV